MDYIEHTLTLSSGYGRDLPPEIAAGVLNSIGPMVRSSILMQFEGRGSAPRRPPKWLKNASDIRFLGAEAREGMVFHFDVPILGEAAGELYQQGELWEKRPAPDDTGFDLLCDVLRDVAEEREDSDLFDDKLLNKLMNLRKVFRRGAERLALSGHRVTANQPVVVTNDTMSSAERLIRATPHSQAVRFVGTLDMIRVSTQHFAVKLDGDENVNGVFLGGDIKELSSLLDNRVVVSGRVIYRPSGRVLRIDAEQVVAGEGEGTIWSRIPLPRERPMVVRELYKRQGPQSGVAAIIGRWPGDETDEEIDEALAAIS